jgi:Dyp-type peroxidase family
MQLSSQIGEPLLAVENIQGHILVPFGMPHELHIFCSARSPQALRRLLRSLVGRVTSTAQLLRVSKRGGTCGDSAVVLLHIALSFPALCMLEPDSDLFVDEAFREGMSMRSVEVLRDPPDVYPIQLCKEGNRHLWVVGGPHNPVDIVLIMASESTALLDMERKRVEESIAEINVVLTGEQQVSDVSLAPLRVVFVQPADLLQAEPRCREHFGFRDPISQPGIRGRISDGADDYLTKRYDPESSHVGRPGQDLIWPGEFVFGYPRQDRFGDTVEQVGPDSLREIRRVRIKEPVRGPAAPMWAKDGSYMVVRRLRQDVQKFEAFLEANATQIGIDKELLAAKLVGRWRSGAPLMRTPHNCDNPELGADEFANNDFAYQGLIAVRPSHGLGQQYPTAQADLQGTVCPFGAHIRKTFPRDDIGTASSTILTTDGDSYLPGDFRDVPPIGLVRTQTHRLLRRGIPYGPRFVPQECDDGNRGLMFVCFQSSIKDQFEFVTRWMNSPDFKDKALDDGTIQTGHDLIAGQSNAGGSRARYLRLQLADENGKARDVLVHATDEWVIATGGGYFFSPSISTLNGWAKSKG